LFLVACRFSYFIVHLYVIHGLMVVFTLARYGTVAFLKNPLPSLGGSAASYPPGFGWDLRVVYLLWVFVCGLVYPVCLFMARLKDRRRGWWLSYI
jgi:hypothetical protein